MIVSRKNRREQMLNTLTEIERETAYKMQTVGIDYVEAKAIMLRFSEVWLELTKGDLR